MVYRRLRAPTDDGGVLIEPPACGIAALVARNVALRKTSGEDADSCALRELRRIARQQLLQAARDYTARYADVAWLDERLSSDRLYLVGHQPELFHPGVWLKNFVLDRLAKHDGAVAVHVLIDNDEAPTPAIRVPTGSLAEPQVENIAYDEPAEPSTWEERKLRNSELFRSFGERVRGTIAPLVSDPLASVLWRNVDAAIATTSTTGQALAQLRHRLELAWGVRTLEVPLSVLVQQPAFRFLSAFLLSELPRLHATYNAALDEYRELHKLRSPSQPMPNLSLHDGAIEAPFWTGTLIHPGRQKLFVKRVEDQDPEKTGWQFRSGPEERSTKAFAVGTGPSKLASKLEFLETFHIKIRPRALVTTLMLRLLASDLFIHGIGGAKYDQVTDRIIENFCGVAPPEFLTVTGTKLLPLPQAGATAGDIERIDRLLRELRFKPEMHIDLAEHHGAIRTQIEQLIAEKRRWVQKIAPPAQLAERHAALASINAELETYVSTRRAALLAERERAQQALGRQAILGSREYSFCLYPEATLRPWLLAGSMQACE